MIDSYKWVKYGNTTYLRIVRDSKQQFLALERSFVDYLSGEGNPEFTVKVKFLDESEEKFKCDNRGLKSLRSGVHKGESPVLTNSIGELSVSRSKNNWLHPGGWDVQEYLFGYTLAEFPEPTKPHPLAWIPMLVF